MRRIFGCVLLAALAGLLALAAASNAEERKQAFSDQQFALKATQAGLAEVNISRLAKMNASSSKVKQFADMMVRDHEKANKELSGLVDKKRWVLAPVITMDPAHQAAATRLGALKGAAFDRDYSHLMLKDHEEAVSLFENASKNARDNDLKAWAGKTLPTLRHHLEDARGLTGQGDHKDSDHKDKDKGDKDKDRD